MGCSAHKSMALFKRILFETFSNGFHCKNTVHLVHSIIGVMNGPLKFLTARKI